MFGGAWGPARARNRFHACGPSANLAEGPQHEHWPRSQKAIDCAQIKVVRKTMQPVPRRVPYASSWGPQGALVVDSPRTAAGMQHAHLSCWKHVPERPEKFCAGSGFGNLLGGHTWVSLPSSHSLQASHGTKTREFVGASHPTTGGARLAVRQVGALQWPKKQQRVATG